MQKALIIDAASPTREPPSEEVMSGSFQVCGNLIDIHQRRVYPAAIDVVQGRIAAIREQPGATPPTYLAPGFVDAHVHVESSLLPPSEFSRLATVHGTVATVSDPHEIANVLGLEGVAWMLADAQQAALKIRFGAPSCVPATPFDHAGAAFGVRETETLLANPAIGYLSEMMNYPGVVAGDPEVLAKLAVARRLGKPIDGHAPALRGPHLEKYAVAGITTDHECVTLDEAREKRDLGMKIQIREGSAAKNFEALRPLLNESPDACMLCSDDKHPHQLIEGHIDALVRRALAGGVDLFDVWRAASANPIVHYGLDVGLLRVGDPADFIEVDAAREPHVLRTWIGGRLVAEKGQSLAARHAVQPINRFAAAPLSAGDFAIRAEGSRARVIEVLDGQLITGQLVLPILAQDGHVLADTERDILKLAVVDRYRPAAPAVALVKNFGLKHGALAASVSHDSHNIVAVGATDDALAEAVNAVIGSSGGLSVAAGGLAQRLPLPIAGLMSDQDGSQVASDYFRMDALAKQLGSRLTDPFMTLSFLALLVIPSLKLSPTGLFDVNEFRHVSLWAP
jgi:adenine deaminase